MSWTYGWCVEPDRLHHSLSLTYSSSVFLEQASLPILPTRLSTNMLLNSISVPSMINFLGIRLPSR